ncbi:MAG: pyridoxine 5'-phosphate synthase, partial [Planctomycetaceae bacterium]|nr:pyridoxine 5'-phosphate synthase [Planctomycetaceae bacterium]
EVTTEGGLDVADKFDSVKKIVGQLQEVGISVSLFLDPDLRQVEAGIRTGCNAIEIHTGKYANAKDQKIISDEITRIAEAGKIITNANLRLHAGHGLTYHNVIPIVKIPNMLELNIGHSIISRAVMVGLKKAVKEMKQLLCNL